MLESRKLTNRNLSLHAPDGNRWRYGSLAVPRPGEGDGPAGVPRVQRQQRRHLSPPPMWSAHYQAALHPHAGRDLVLLGNHRGTLTPRFCSVLVLYCRCGVRGGNTTSGSVARDDHESECILCGRYGDSFECDMPHALAVPKTFVVSSNALTLMDYRGMV